MIRNLNQHAVLKGKKGLRIPYSEVLRDQAGILALTLRKCTERSNCVEEGGLTTEVLFYGTFYDKATGSVDGAGSNSCNIP